MKGEQDIFDRIRQEAEGLQARPSARAWRRLEQRLEGRRRRHRVSLYRSLGMVAAVLALVVTLTLFALLLDRMEDQRHLAQRVERSPKHLQDLPVGEAHPRAIKVMEYNRAYQGKVPMRIEEGDPRKRLRPATRSQPL